MRVFLLAGLLLAYSCGGDGGAGGGSGSADQEAVAQSKATPRKPSVVGRWRLLGEEAANGKYLSLEQQIKEYEFNEDGTYSVKAYHQNWTDKWALDGETLILLVDFKELEGDLDARAGSVRALEVPRQSSWTSQVRS